jgi:hypothetical protein
MNILICNNEFYTSEKFASLFLKSKTWRVQMTQPDGSVSEGSHVFYEGNDTDRIINLITEDYGEWCLTEVKTQEQDQQDNDFLQMFDLGNAEPERYIVRKLLIHQ